MSKHSLNIFSKLIKNAVTSNAQWYGDGSPTMPRRYDSQNTSKDRKLFARVLRKGRNERSGECEARLRLAEILDSCRPGRRCGILSCPECKRAFQRAFTVAQKRLVNRLRTMLEGQLVFITLIPTDWCFPCGRLVEFDLREFNASLLAKWESCAPGLPFTGATDLSFERSGSQKFLQPHLHLCTCTPNRLDLERALKTRFLPSVRYERPIKVKPAMDTNFILYIHKIYKTAELIRSQRRELPEFLLALRSVQPLDVLVTNESAMLRDCLTKTIVNEPTFLLEGKQRDFDLGSGRSSVAVRSIPVSCGEHQPITRRARTNEA